MPDYVLTKEGDKATGELPDKITVVLPPHHAWLLVKQMLIQLEQCNRAVSVDVYGTLEKVGK